MIKKLKSNLIRNKLKEQGLFVFAPFDLQKYFGVTANTVSLFLTRNTKNNNIIKLRRGFYVFKGEYVNEFLIANQVYKPSYVSFEYALMFYGIIPETVYAITSVTTKITREFIIKNISYDYHHIKKQAFTGYVKKYFDGQMALIAEPEKALADYLYFVSLGKKELNDRLNLKPINKKKLIYYAKLFKRKNLLNLVNQIYDDQRRNRKIIH